MFVLSDHSKYPTRSPGCEGFQDDIALLAIGTLDGYERSELLLHLDFCVHCASLYLELSEVVRALGALIPLANGFVRSHGSHHGFDPEIRRYVQSVKAATAVGLAALPIDRSLR